MPKFWVAIDWRQAALRVGEELATAGPAHYYAMTPEQWRDWCLEAIWVLKRAGWTR